MRPAGPDRHSSAANYKEARGAAGWGGQAAGLEAGGGAGAPCLVAARRCGASAIVSKSHKQDVLLGENSASLQPALGTGFLQLL